MSGAEPDAVAHTRTTGVNPAVLDAAALLIVGSREQHVYPGVAGHEPNLAQGRATATKISAAMKIIRDATPGSGSYSNEADYFVSNEGDYFEAD